jgi:hypothetical protein
LLFIPLVFHHPLFDAAFDKLQGAPTGGDKKKCVFPVSWQDYCSDSIFDSCVALPRVSCVQLCSIVLIVSQGRVADKMKRQLVG